jgi:hypothetical protein
MKVIEAGEVEKLVRATFPAKRGFSADVELGLAPGAPASIAFVHGGPDPFLDRQFDSWLDGVARFVPVHQILNRLCRAGALAPGDYAVTRRGTA